MSTIGVANARNGAMARFTCRGITGVAQEHQHRELAVIAAAGTNGMGGAGITAAIDGSTLPARRRPSGTIFTITSADAGSNNNPPTTAARVKTKLERVTMPKFPPPPRMAQNRSGCYVSSTFTISPAAVTTSAASRLSMVRPYLRT